MLSFIKSLFLGFRKHRAIKENTAVRQNISFRQAKNIGIVFAIDNIKSPESFTKFVKSLHQEGRKLEIIGYAKQGVAQNFTFKPTIFSYKDISLWGEIKNDELNRFIATPFDYLFCLGNQPLSFFDYILAHSSAKCRICQYAANRQLVSEIIIKPTPNAPEKKLYERFLHYTQLL